MTTLEAALNIVARNKAQDAFGIQCFTHLRLFVFDIAGRVGGLLRRVAAPLLHALLRGKRLVRVGGGGIGNHADLSGAAYAPHSG